jgi:hypothetical protein
VESSNITRCSFDENKGVEVGGRGGGLIYYGRGRRGLQSKGELAE